MHLPPQLTLTGHSRRTGRHTPRAGDRRLRWLLVLICLTSLTGCHRDSTPRPAAQDRPRRVTLALNWFPEAEHGGFFAALVHGYYEAEGLDVVIRPGGPGSPVIQQTAGKQVDFAIANADQVLLGREQEAPVVAVMTTMQTSPRCIMVHESSGIQNLRELKNLTLAVENGKPFARYLINEIGESGLDIIPYQGSVAMFLERSDFAQQGYVFSEPFVAEKAGGDPSCLLISDIGFNPYAGLLITHDSFLQDHPDVVRKVVRASVRGWQHYLREPDATNHHIHRLNEEMPLDVLEFGAEAIRPLCLSDEVQAFGQMTKQRWETLAQQMAELKVLDRADVWQHCFTTEFLP